MKKRFISIILSLAMVAGLTITAHAEEARELTVMMLNDWVSGTAYSDETAAKLSAFEEAHPGVTIHLEGASQQDIKEKFQTSALAGGGADLVTMDNSGHAIDLAAMGLLYPLSEMISAEELETMYQPGPLNSGKFQGEYYSIPWYMDCCGLVYNAERLEELGIEAPTNWEELKDALDKVLAAGYGGIITYQSAYAFYPFFYQNNCPVIDTSGDIPEVVIDTEEGKEAWNYICDLIESGAFVESFKEATNWDKVYESLANGEATFLLGGDWNISGVLGINPDIKLGVATMPEHKTQATVLGGWTWNINVNCKYPDLAWELAQYLSSEECDSILAASGGKLSARIGFDFEAALADNPNKEILSVFTEQFPYTNPRPAIVNEKAIDEMITDAIDEVLFGNVDRDTALENLAAALRDNVKSNYE